MEAKCSFCDLFGEKPHCHNCKIFKKTKTHVPQEIDCSLEELVEYINTHEDVTERFGVGDYKTIELYTGEKVKMILLDTDKDDLAEGEGNAKTTFGILTYDGLFRINKENTNRTSWKDCEMRTRMERIFRLLPEIIRNNIKPVVKRTSAGGGSREIIMTTDKCFLFSEVEIRGEVQYSRPGEGVALSAAKQPLLTRSTKRKSLPIAKTTINGMCLWLTRKKPEETIKMP